MSSWTKFSSSMGGLATSVHTEGGHPSYLWPHAHGSITTSQFNEWCDRYAIFGLSS